MPIPPLPFSRSSIAPGDRICCAVSGGADSVALLLSLHAANTLGPNALGVGLSAVHIHHGLRGEAADLDAAFVESLCQRLGISLHLQRVDVPAHAATSGEGTEEAARTLRYQVFHELLASGKATAILTAHTLDDQAETVLMKLLRGAWTDGLSAIYPLVQPDAAHPGKIIRPLLTVRRAQIEEYLRTLDQPWREDASNADTAFTRNRLRHELLPTLRTYNPAIDQTLANLAELAREEESRWRTELDRLLPQILLPGKPVRGGGRAVSTAPGEQALAIELERLRGFDPALRRRILRAAARRLGARLSFDETARLLALAGLGTHPNVAARAGAALHLSHGLRAERSHREIRLYVSHTP